MLQRIAPHLPPARRWRVKTFRPRVTNRDENPPAKALRKRLADNAKRYRGRYNTGQTILKIPVYPDRVERFLARLGRLHPDKTVEEALALLIDDEGHE